MLLPHSKPIRAVQLAAETPVGKLSCLESTTLSSLIHLRRRLARSGQTRSPPDRKCEQVHPEREGIWSPAPPNTPTRVVRGTPESVNVCGNEGTRVKDFLRLKNQMHSPVRVHEANNELLSGPEVVYTRSIRVERQCRRYAPIALDRQSDPISRPSRQNVFDPSILSTNLEYVDPELPWAKLLARLEVLLMRPESHGCFLVRAVQSPL